MDLVALDKFPVKRLAAFSHGNLGGNPAGVVICKVLPDPSLMQDIAAEVGYSETAFAAPVEGGWRVRYFALEIEVPFCGHATIALGAALAIEQGNGSFRLHLNATQITVEGVRTSSGLTAALQSPSTRSESADSDQVRESLALFGYGEEDLDARLPPAVAEAGARHIILALKERSRLAAMRYDLATGRRLMLMNGIATIDLVYAKTPRVFHARNPFAAGGVYEDPATGAAAAALAGYLRDIGWDHGGAIEIFQGEDMGVPSHIHAEIPFQRGSSIRISGAVRVLQ